MSDWCVGQKRDQRDQKIHDMCYSTKKSRYADDDEDDEPITLDKVIGLLNGDDSPFITSSPTEKTIPREKETNNVDKNKSTKYDLNVSVEIKNGDAESEMDSEDDEFNESESEQQKLFNKRLQNKDNGIYSDNEFDDSDDDKIEIPLLQTDTEDDDEDNLLTKHVPKITSIKSLNPKSSINQTKSSSNHNNTTEGKTTLTAIRKLNSRLKEKENELNILRIKNDILNDYGFNHNESRRSHCESGNWSESSGSPAMSYTDDSEVEFRGFDSTPPRNQSGPKIPPCVTPESDIDDLQSEYDLLEPIRFDTVIQHIISQDNTNINKVKRRNKQEREPIKKINRVERRRRCRHCNHYFYKEDLKVHLNEISDSFSEEETVCKLDIMDKLLKIPVVNVHDISKDETLDPKLKARLRFQIFKLTNNKNKHRLFCVHCDLSFHTKTALKNHVFDVIYGLDLLDYDLGEMGYKKYQCRVRLS